MVKAIVYTSNSGYTADYAKLISQETGIQALTLDEAKSKLAKGDEIFYMGWLMAANVKGLGQAKKNYKICGLCGVGLQASEGQRQTIKKNSKLSDDIPVYQIQGGFDMDKLKGLDKFIMKIVSRKILGELAAKDTLSPEALTIKKLLTEGGSCVSKENAADIIAFLKK
ncbi:MAG: hypothetical protein K5839_00310 [Treponemataceae bacterium]|nr:hypothetical protein [Treponemataceae bacterium]